MNGSHSSHKAAHTIDDVHPDVPKSKPNGKPLVNGGLGDAKRFPIEDAPGIDSWKNLTWEEKCQLLLGENRWNRENEVDIEGPSMDWAGWELLNNAGYGTELRCGVKGAYALRLFRDLEAIKGVRDTFEKMCDITDALDELLGLKEHSLSENSFPTQPQMLQSKEDIELDAIWAKKAHLDELIEDIAHGLAHSERKNAFGVIMLIDGHWLRWGHVNVYLEDAALVEGVIVQTLISPIPVTTIVRGEIREWLHKVEKAKRCPPVTSPPFSQGSNAAIAGPIGAA